MDKRFKCAQLHCNQSFTTSGHLSRHGKIHTGEKNHSCPIKDCNSKFARRDNMLQHFTSHRKKLISRNEEVVLESIFNSSDFHPHMAMDSDARRLGTASQSGGNVTQENSINANHQPLPNRQSGSYNHQPFHHQNSYLQTIHRPSLQSLNINQESPYAPHSTQNQMTIDLNHYQQRVYYDQPTINDPNLKLHPQSQKAPFGFPSIFPITVKQEPTPSPTHSPVELSAFDLTTSYQNNLQFDSTVVHQYPKSSRNVRSAPPGSNRTYQYQHRSLSNTIDSTYNVYDTFGESQTGALTQGFNLNDPCSSFPGSSNELGRYQMGTPSATFSTDDFAFTEFPRSVSCANNFTGTRAGMPSPSFHLDDTSLVSNGGNNSSEFDMDPSMFNLKSDVELSSSSLPGFSLNVNEYGRSNTCSSTMQSSHSFTPADSVLFNDNVYKSHQSSVIEGPEYKKREFLVRPRPSKLRIPFYCKTKIDAIEEVFSPVDVGLE